ncbi:DHA2 family efflux MFS transporter permease subunit [Bifidobacterium felsineum]|uniref:Multidrug transporter n=1 Tax=Bifidobacterium felsineum TaxID=2045440 RepID=A0A2M9HKQ6_9BIFI|nr:DHA2 family efflux MFS transporter permease subunit [Bifidobacterium felsineum]MBT1163578.1 DHA2 family efflux MFS transporter permease subunit [Bifidobacterium felsineum]PJM77390.1 multidrug transporter [Bifidobacterium felsineum]
MGLTRKQRITVIVLLTGTVLAILDLSFLSPALPSIMEDFSIDATTAQWLSSAYSLVEALIIPLSAYLLGRFSTKRLFVAAMGIFSAGSLLAAWGPNFAVLLVGRVCQAACTGILLPMVMTEIVLIFPRERRGTAMGLIGLLVGFAPAIGPTVSGLLIDSVGWHALFLIVGVLGIIILCVAMVVLETKETAARTPFDALSVALSSIGLLCILYGLSTFASTSNTTIIIVLIVIGAALIALFVVRQLRLEQPMLDMRVFRSRRFSSSVAVIALTQGVYLGIGTVLPLFVQIVKGESAVMSGLVVLPGALLSAAMALVSGKLYDRFGVHVPARAGSVCTLAGIALLATMPMDTSMPVVAIAYTLCSVGVQLIITPCNTWGINSLSNALVRHANAAAQTSNQISNSFMVALIISFSALSSVIAPKATELEAAYYGDKIAFIAAAAILLALAAFIAIFIRDRKTDTIVE